MDKKLLLLVLILIIPLATALEGYDNPRSGFSADTQVSVLDTAVYNTGYLSADGSDWQPFSLSGQERGNWVVGEATADIDLTGIRYVAIFSCSWNTGWDCGSTWQVRDRGETPAEPDEYLDSVQGDFEALQDLYTATNGANWDVNDGWSSMTPQTMHQAYGVEVNANGRVIKLDLTRNNLQGSLPDSIGNLQKIQYFSVKGNPLYSSIPQSIENWKDAEYLLLSGGGDGIPSDHPHPGKHEGWGSAKYYGTLPDVFDKMPNLKVIDLFWNKDMDDQPYPSTLYKHPSLTHILLSGNQFTGELIDDFDLPELEVIHLGSNKLEGNLPGTLATSTKLTKLDFGHSNQFRNGHDQITETASHFFTGTIPDSWANFVNMKRFSLRGHNLEGTIPSYIIKNWSDLISFNIGGNNFYGAVPGEFGDFNLYYFGISGNNFGLDENGNPLPLDEGGSLHPRIISGMQGVIIFSIHDNHFRGEIPNGEMIDGEWKGWRTKQRLRTTYLFNNDFSGRLPDLPEYVGDMSVYLAHRNNFEGGIPDTWKEAFTPELRDVNPSRTFGNLQIRGNQLQGILPEWFTADNLDATNLDIRGNRWSHRDILENNVNVIVGDNWDGDVLPFGYPEEVTLFAGENFSFDYTHKIHPTDNVQWTKDEQPISGGEDGILLIDSVGTQDTGLYRLELTNPTSGLPETIVSEPITLQVS